MVCLWKCSTSPWRSLKQLKHPNLTHGTARLLSLSGIHGRRTAAWRCVSVRIIRSVHLLIAQLPVPDATLSSPRWRAVMKAFAQDSADNHNLLKIYLFLNQKIKVRKEKKKKKKRKKRKRKKRTAEARNRTITSAYQPIANAFPLGQNGQLCASVVWLCNVRSPQIVSAMAIPVYHIVTSWFVSLRPVYLIIAWRPLIKKYMDSGWKIKSVDQTEANSPPCWRVQLISCRLFGAGY